MDRLDAIPIRSNEEEDRRQSLRYLYWLCLQTDLLFRLLLDKPPMIRWKVGRVKPPTLFSTSHMGPTADQSRCYVVWIRFTVLTAEVMDCLEDPEQRRSPEVIQKVDQYCSELEELVADWKLVCLVMVNIKDFLSANIHARSTSANLQKRLETFHGYMQTTRSTSTPVLLVFED